MDLHDVRVLQTCDGLGFDLKADSFLKARAPTGEDHLESDNPIQLRLLGPVDDAHAAAAEFAENLETGHRRTAGLYRGHRPQVRGEPRGVFVHRQCGRRLSLRRRDGRNVVVRLQGTLQGGWLRRGLCGSPGLSIGSARFVHGLPRGSGARREEWPILLFYEAPLSLSARNGRGVLRGGAVLASWEQQPIVSILLQLVQGLRRVHSRYRRVGDFRSPTR